MQVDMIRRVTLTIVDEITMVAELEDLAPRQGRVTLRLPGAVHAAYWANMGDRTVDQFVREAPDTKYLVGHFDRFGTLYRKINVPYMKQVLAADIEVRNFTDDRKVELLSEMGQLTPISDIQGIMVLVPDFMQEIYGPSWATEVGKFQGYHESYVDLCKAVETLQLVVKDHLPQ